MYATHQITREGGNGPRETIRLFHVAANGDVYDLGHPGSDEEPVRLDMLPKEATERECRRY